MGEYEIVISYEEEGAHLSIVVNDWGGFVDAMEVYNDPEADENEEE